MILSNHQRNIFTTVLILFGGYFTAFTTSAAESKCPPEIKTSNQIFRKPTFGTDTTYWAMFRNRGVQVKIMLPPKSVNGMILLLPGWNLADVDWSAKTNVCSRALSMNFGLVFVEMGKSVYMDSFYPSMRKDYQYYPTRTWLWDTVIKPLQDYGWFAPGSSSFALGLSTGARGALILAIEHQECFRGVAGLSGDYNPLLDKKDGLMVNTLGVFEKNEFRWKGTNNISLRSKELNVHTFLAHGENDQIVPIAQTFDFWGRLEKTELSKTVMPLKKSKSEVSITRAKLKSSTQKNTFKKLCLLTVKDANHDYQFWDFAGQKAIDFFSEILAH